MSVRVRALGGLSVYRDSERIGDLPAQPVRCALLLYLALEREASRDQLTALLWPESDAERARHSLSQTLYQLRRTLGDDWVRAAGDRVEATTYLESDALEFIRAAESGRDEDALSAYAGPFLAGTHLGGTRPFEEWADGWRTRLARFHRTVCRRLANARRDAGDLEGALAVASRWVELDFMDDEAQHLLIELLAAAGQRAEAIRQYEAYAERIGRELDAEPLERTRQLAEHIRAEHADPRAGSGATRAEASAASHTARTEGEQTASGAPRQGRRMWVAAAVLAGLLLLVGGLHLRTGSRDEPAGVVAGDRIGREASGIVVLPFANLGPGEDQEYFSDGITEDLHTALSRIDGLRVVSRTSALRYKGSDLPLSAVARELGVEYVLEGSVRRDGEQVRISVQLIDASTDSHLWAETYDRELGGIFAIQSEIAERIAAALERRLSPTDRARIAAGGTESVSAYDLLLRGREYLNRPGGADVRKFPPAMRFFRSALEIDSAYARAHVGLSDAFRGQVSLPPTIRRDSALAYARRAVELDPRLAEAATALGWAYLLAGAWDDAGTEFRRALREDPNDAGAMVGMARLAWIRGRQEEALGWQLRAARNDPYSAPVLTALGDYVLNLGDLDGAAEVYSRAAALAPDFPQASYMLAQVHLIRGESVAADERMRVLAEAAAGHPGTHFLVGRFDAQRGRYEAADARLAEAANLLEGATATVALQRAYVALRLGRTDEAAELLRAAGRDLDDREAEGFPAPRLRLQLHALLGDLDAVSTIVREHRYTELAGTLIGGPQLGVYWLDHDPLLSGIRDEPVFRELLGQIRSRQDSVRTRVAVFE